MDKKRQGFMDTSLDDNLRDFPSVHVAVKRDARLDAQICQGTCELPLILRQNKYNCSTPFQTTGENRYHTMFQTKNVTVSFCSGRLDRE